MNIVLSNAAQSYGISDLTDLAPVFNAGSVVATNFSVDPASLRLGQSFGASVTYSNGFIENLQATLSSSTTLTLTGYSLVRSDNGATLLSVGGSVAIPLNTAAIPSIISLMGSADNITGNDFNNRLEGFGGNDVINGGAGIDTAVYRGFKSQYTVTKTGATTATVSGGIDGTDTLVNVERIKFTDSTLALDINGNAGQAYRLYQAALNRAPDQAGLGAQVRGLDGGLTLEQLSTLFLNSPEFQQKYGALNNTQFVTQLYANVLHRAPDAAGLANHVNNLDHGQGRATLLAGFSESAENQANLIGVMANGVTYTG